MKDIYNDNVNGIVIGDISRDFDANFRTVETWLAHGKRIEYPVRNHRFSSTLYLHSEILAEYIAKHTRRSVLGDGTPLLVTLEFIPDAR